MFEIEIPGVNNATAKNSRVLKFITLMESRELHPTIELTKRFEEIDDYSWVESETRACLTAACRILARHRVVSLVLLTECTEQFLGQIDMGSAAGERLEIEHSTDRLREYVDSCAAAGMMPEQIHVYAMPPANYENSNGRLISERGLWVATLAIVNSADLVSQTSH